MSARKEIPRDSSSGRKVRFLEELAVAGRADLAAEKIGISRDTVYQWRQRDPAFVIAMDKARREASLLLEDEAKRRAVEGVDEPVFYLGQECGTIRKYSDTLLIFLLKANNPEKFRETTRHELTGKDGSPLLDFSNPETRAKTLENAKAAIAHFEGKK